tara:strand:+ start:12563 stop:13168 length:606 start_codon:yes stop_codon:yes gene_type:complete
MMSSRWGELRGFARASFGVSIGADMLLDAGGEGIESDLGQRSGSFLFYLELLVLSLSKVVMFSLDNFTDDPDRAADRDKGIYGLLDPASGVGTRAERLQDSCGHMLFRMRHDTSELVLRRIEGMKPSVASGAVWTGIPFNVMVHNLRNLVTTNHLPFSETQMALGRGVGVGKRKARGRTRRHRTGRRKVVSRKRRRTRVRR